MDVMKNKKVAYCVDFVTVRHCTKFHPHVCNIGNCTEGALCGPPGTTRVQKPGINRVKIGIKCFSRIFAHGPWPEAIKISFSRTDQTANKR